MKTGADFDSDFHMDSNINLTALTIVLDYLHDNQFLATDDWYLGEFTKNLEEGYRLFLSQT